MAEFSKTNCKKGLSTLVQKSGKEEAPIKGMRAADRNTRVTEDNVTILCMK